MKLTSTLSTLAVLLCATLSVVANCSPDAGVHVSSSHHLPNKHHVHHHHQQGGKVVAKPASKGGSSKAAVNSATGAGARPAVVKGSTIPPNIAAHNVKPLGGSSPSVPAAVEDKAAPKQQQQQQVRGDATKPVAVSNGSNSASASSGKVVHAATTAAAVATKGSFNPGPSTAGGKRTTTCDITKYGAKPNSDIGPALLSAFNNCILSGSGSANKVLLIPSGSWTLSSHVVLRKGVDYTVQWDGTISVPHDESIGGGPMLQWAYATRVLIQGQGSFLGGGVKWRANGLNNNRPRLVSLYKCTDSEFTGVRLDDAPMFHLSMSECTGMRIHDFVISSPPPYKGSTDGVDVSCTNCKIWNLDITNGDDSVVMKSPAHNVEIHNITVAHGYGIGIGTVGKGGVFDITNIVARDIKLNGATAGLYVKSYSSATGVIRNVTMTDVTLNGVAKPIAIDPYWQGGSMDTPDPNQQPSKLAISDFYLANWSGTGDSTTRPTIFLNGSPAVPMKNMQFDNVVLGKQGGRTPQISIKNACGTGLSQLSKC